MDTLLVGAFSLAALVLFSSPSPLIGQESYWCRDCNNLTGQCETEPVGGGRLDDRCYENENESGPYCASWGGLEDCEQMAMLTVDGIVVPGTDVIWSTVAPRWLGVEAQLATDCRDRVRAIAFTVERGEELRAATRRLTI